MIRSAAVFIRQFEGARRRAWVEDEAARARRGPARIC